MVEDEFYAIAQSFTQHLHYAEYIRRKKEAKTRIAATNDIQRPTDGRTKLSKEAERRKDAEALTARQKAGLARLEGPEEAKDDSDDDDDDDTWAGTHLHGLMTSPRKSRSLMGAHALKSSTRAAAGFGQATSSSSQRAAAGAVSSMAAAAHDLPVHEEVASDEEADLDGETASDEDDDLDGRARPIRIPQSHRLRNSARPQNTQITRESINTMPKIQEVKDRVPPRPANGFKSRVQMLFDDLDELPEPSRFNVSSTSNMKKDTSSTNNNTHDGPETDNLESKKPRFNDVPTFLF